MGCGCKKKVKKATPQQMKHHRKPVTLQELKATGVKETLDVNGEKYTIFRPQKNFTVR